jgi:hypothetical protein
VTSGVTYARLAAGVLVILAVVVALANDFRRMVEPGRLLLLLCAFLLLISPGYPWYYAVAVPLLARQVYLPLLYVSLLVPAIYIEIDNVWLTPYPRFKVMTALYVGFLLLAIGDWWRRRHLQPSAASE